MTTTVILRPTAVVAAPWARGTFVATGAASVTAAVNDSSDSSYISVSPSYTGNPVAGASINFSVQQQALPAGARFKYIKPYIRTNRTVPAARSAILRIHDGRTPNVLTSVVTSTIYIDTTIGDFYPGGESVVPPSPSSTLLTQDYMNNIFVECFGPYVIDGAIRIYEMGVQAVYDLAPTATILSPTGTLSTTNSPTVTWLYADDSEIQSAYQVQIYDTAGTTLIHDSGVVSSSASLYRVPIVLPNASYKVQVRVAQKWDHEDLSPGVFWSAWTPQTAFTLLTINPAQPSIVVTPNVQNDGKLSIAAVTNQNLLDYSGQSFELGAATWSPVNATFATTNAQFRSGGLSAIVTTTGASGRIVSPTFAVDASIKYGFSYFAQKPAAAGATSVDGRIDWFNSSAIFVSSSANVTVTPVNGSWTQGVNAALTPPAGAKYGQVRFTVATSGQTLWLDDVFVWASDTVAGLSPTPGAPTYAVNTMRGGLVNQTPNGLLYQDSTNELSTTNWAPNNASVALALSTTQALHGTQSVRVTRVGTTGTAQIDLAAAPSLATSAGALAYFAIPQGAVGLNASARVFSTVSRTADMIVRFYDQGLNVLSTTTGPATTTLNAWSAVSAAVIPVSVNAAYASISVDVQAVAVGEFHYFDNFFLQATTSGGDYSAAAIGPTLPGYTQFSSALLVEYQDAGTTTWTTLKSFTTNPGNVVYTYDDYEVASGVARTYRATLGAMVDNATFYSPSASAVGTETMSGVWLHTLANPSGTIHNFMYDGDGSGGASRSDTYDTNAVEFQAAGRQYPLVDFGEHRARKVAVSLLLPSASDTTAFNTIAAYQGLVMYRDGRGRRGRGYIKDVTFTDVGPGQKVSFSFVYSGNQPGTV